MTISEFDRDTLTLEEAAKRLGVTVGVARRAARAGDLPVIRLGRSVLILRWPFEKMLGRLDIASTERPTDKTNWPRVFGANFLNQKSNETDV